MITEAAALLIGRREALTRRATNDDPMTSLSVVADQLMKKTARVVSESEDIDQIQARQGGTTGTGRGGGRQEGNKTEGHTDMDGRRIHEYK